jgi:hypothetical protein
MAKPTHDRKVPAAESPNRRAGLRRDELLPGETTDDTDKDDRNMSGAPGGGMASGGMGGTNAGDGSIDDVDLAGALGSADADTNGDNIDEGEEPQAGRSGGAVGETPANKRASRQ